MSKRRLEKAKDQRRVKRAKLLDATVAPLLVKQDTSALCGLLAGTAPMLWAYMAPITRVMLGMACRLLTELRRKAREERHARQRVDVAREKAKLRALGLPTGSVDHGRGVHLVCAALAVGDEDMAWFVRWILLECDLPRGTTWHTSALAASVRSGVCELASGLVEEACSNGNTGQLYSAAHEAVALGNLDMFEALATERDSTGLFRYVNSYSHLCGLSSAALFESARFDVLDRWWTMMVRRNKEWLSAEIREFRVDHVILLERVEHAADLPDHNMQALVVYIHRIDVSCDRTVAYAKRLPLAITVPACAGRSASFKLRVRLL